MVVAIPFLRCGESREISQLGLFSIGAERDPVGIWSTIVKDTLEPQDIAAQIDRGFYARLAPTSLLTDRVSCLARWGEKIASRTQDSSWDEKGAKEGGCGITCSRANNRFVGCTTYER
jgi:hypothetical protein